MIFEDHVMQPGSTLKPTHGIKSANGLYGLLYQGDGNLVLYGPDGALWDAGTNGRGAGVCIMQTDGNLVLYGPDDEYVWDSKINNNPGSRLIIQDDGNMVIYRPDGSQVWATETRVSPSSAAQDHVMPPAAHFPVVTPTMKPGKRSTTRTVETLHFQPRAPA